MAWCLINPCRCSPLFVTLNFQEQTEGEFALLDECFNLFRLESPFQVTERLPSVPTSSSGCSGLEAPAGCPAGPLQHRERTAPLTPVPSRPKARWIRGSWGKSSCMEEGGLGARAGGLPEP